jgi:hypothetical protein
MTQIDFPNNPTLNDEFTIDKLIWSYDGVKWNLKNTLIISGPTGPTGPTGETGTSIKSTINIILDNPQYDNTYNVNLNSGTYILLNPSITQFIFNSNDFVNTASKLVTLPTSVSSITINKLFPSSVSISGFNSNYLYRSGKYVNNQYLIFGDSQVYISTNATTWTLNNITEASDIQDFTYGNSLYVIVGNGGILSSTDLITWTTRSINQHGSIIYQNSQFTALNATNSYIEVSTNGITWSTRNTGSFVNGSKIKYLNNIYIIGNSSGNIRTSTDTVTWSITNTGTTSQVRSFAYFNNKYVFGYSDGTIRTSTDLVTWSSSGAIFTQTVNDIIYKNGIFIGVGYTNLSTTSQIRVSTDAVTWDIITNPNAGYSGSYYFVFDGGNNYFGFKSVNESTFSLYDPNGKFYSLYKIDGGA